VPESSPPSVPRHPTSRSVHGRTLEDPYEWLRDDENPAVIAHLEAENAYLRRRTAHLEGLRDRIYGEITARVLDADVSVPVRLGDWWYFGRTVEGAQYGLRCRVPVHDPDDWTPPRPEAGVPLPGEQVLLDGNKEAQGHDFFALGTFDVTPDGTRLAYAVDTVGDERYTLRVRDLSTGEDLPDVIEDTAAGACFAPDGASVLYPTVDEAWRPDRVWRHVLGSSEPDELLHHEQDERFWLGIGRTRDHRFVELEISSQLTSETRLWDPQRPELGFQTVWPRREGVLYGVEDAVIDGVRSLLVLHNDGAPNFELVVVPAEDPGTGPEGARVLIARSDEVRLEDVSVFERFVTIDYRRDALTRLAVAPVEVLAGPAFRPEDHELVFDEEIYSVGSAGNDEPAQPTVRFAYGSMVTPASVYDLVVETGERLLRKQQHVRDYDPADYRQARLWVRARDGVHVPVSLTWKAEAPERAGTEDTGGAGARSAVPEGRPVPPPAPRPLVLYGYGAYESSTDPGFSPGRLSLLDRGAVFAIAHVRGGGELGRGWYENGKLAHKPNTFTDFVDVARALVEQGWTTPERLVAEGGSAGGLLMGAVANLAPELFAGILADVPFVDPLTTMLDPSLPLTVIERDEWGDPLGDPEAFDLIASYSPYGNVREGVRYPRILAVTSLHDTRVSYVEPAKWVARLREVGADALLQTEMDAGHGGVSGRYDARRQRAFELAWILDVLGLAEDAERG